SLEADRFLKKQLDRLVYGPKNLRPGQKRACFEKLATMFSEGGLEESGIREADVPYLQRLLNAGLIFGELAQGKVKWKVSREFENRANMVRRVYKLDPEDYLVRIYSPQAEAKSKPRNETVEAMETLMSKMRRDQVYDFLDVSKTLYAEVVGKPHDFFRNEGEARELANKCADSLSSLTRAYLVYEQIPIPAKLSGNKILEFWTDFWWSPEILHQCSRLAESQESANETAPILLNFYREAFPQLFEFFRKQYEQSRRIRIPLVNLTNEEIKLFNDCRDWIIESRYVEIADRLSTYIERKLRKFLLDEFTLLYGERESRLAHLDKTSRGYIKDETARDGSRLWSPAANEMQLLNRKQYKDIMTGTEGSPEGRQNWLGIFSSTFQGWSETDLHRFLDTFGEVNIIASHKKDSALGLEQEHFVQKFVQDSIDFLIRINRAYLRILGQGVLRRESPTSFRFSFCNFKDASSTTPVEIQPEEASRFAGRFSNGRSFVVYFDDQGRTKDYFDIGYRCLCAMLSLLANQSEDEKRKSKITLMILSTKGPEVRCALTNAEQPQGAPTSASA
ncbi:MAG: hypothetical protein JRM82_02210, partial [Nitrososphaerota archaeon]|nr:hypothetical protein [Nitrososphaerota archaeon]